MTMGKKLYVGNLSPSVDRAVLDRLFGEHGTVAGSAVICDRSTGESKGFGFVEMSNESQARAAITALDGREHAGQRLTVTEARQSEEHTRSGSGFRTNRKSGG
jgi:RNA recognition motif-containing protein